MKMRFWQKTYIFTLVLFLACLNIGILSLAFYTHGKTVEATEAAVKAEQYYVAMNFERDYADLAEANTNMPTPSLLMQSFCNYYGKKGVLLKFNQQDVCLYSNFKHNCKISPNSLLHTDFDGKRHIVISSMVCDDKYELVFAKDVSSLDSEFRSLMITYVPTAVVVSLVLAVALYFILKKLSSPLGKLRKTTELIQNGDYTVTAEETGNDEFTLLAQSFNTMIKKVNEQIKTLELDADRKQMLVDNLAHELRTPLTSIHGYAEYLEKASITEEQRIDAAGYIVSEAERLQKISETLLDGAFIRGNKPDMAPLDLAQVLTDVTEKLQPKAKQMEVNLVCEATELTVNGNETLLSMLFYNLVENAVKACSIGGRVRLYCDGGTVCVEDNGKGMTAEQLLHITEPFYRTDKSRSRAEGGAGLGLALCKQIAETHGTLLQFESAEGKGTKVFADFTSLIQDRDKFDI